MSTRLGRKSTKRGDTIIEVMFAIAVFSLVAVLSVMSMDSGINNGENALETVTARNEINAQAEALRFIHSSYISEKTLPLRGELTNEQYNRGEKYQQYEMLWRAIVENAISLEDAKKSGLLNLADTVNNSDLDGAIGCERVYEVTDKGSLLSQVHAFILNTRNLSSLDSDGRADVNVSYISARTNPEFFTAAPLNARILFTTERRFQQIKDNDSAFDSDQDENSSGQFTDGDPVYRYVARAEGVWVFAVKQVDNEGEQYYDFYIQSCWYGPDTTSPTTIDTVIRLYNPEKVKFVPTGMETI